ncbi:MAG: hypothetical protein ACI915_005431 [Gammaproteobacteria bacterium]|jgi:hypothetical protein
MYCGPNAYGALTGAFPRTEVARMESPSGKQWEENSESLERHFPKAWTIYGWKDSPEQVRSTSKRP